MIDGIFQAFVTGFVVKSIASFDDTLTRVPQLVNLTRTFKGKVSYSVGTLLALTTVLLIVIFFSNLLHLIPFRQQLVSLLIFVLALAVYFELFSPGSSERVSRKIDVEPTAQRLTKLLAVGYLISFITYIDDAIVLIPLFNGGVIENLYSIVGVYSAALLQIVVVIFFSNKIRDIKYRKHIASFSLIVLSVLVWFGVV